MKTDYQKGELPTATEMKRLATVFTTEQWEKLTKNRVFMENFDKDLNAMAIAAEMILANKAVLSLDDIKIRISS